MNSRQLRVCYFGTYRADYSRNQIMIKGLRQSGVEVTECHRALWQGIEDRVQVASGGWLKPTFIARIIRAYWGLLKAHRKVSDYDVMVLGYPGQPDVFLARLLTWLRHRPLVLDVFMSLFLIASERGLTAQHRITGRLLHCLEQRALLMPDLLIQDTPEYVQWLHGEFGIDAARFRLVPTGADDRVFRPSEHDGRKDDLFRVLYYGTFIPNHGVLHIVEAARLLANESAIRLELIGNGPDREAARALVHHYDLATVEFQDWLDKDELVRRIAAADICLGVFGTTPQSQMTIQNKIYEGLAMARPVITGDSPAVRRSLAHGTHVYLCERANPEALASAIRVLKGDPNLRRHLAQGGHRFYHAQFSLQHNGARYKEHLLKLVADHRRGKTQPGSPTRAISDSERPGSE